MTNNNNPYKNSPNKNILTRMNALKGQMLRNTFMINSMARLLKGRSATFHERVSWYGSMRAAAVRHAKLIKNLNKLRLNLRRRQNARS